MIYSEEFDAIIGSHTPPDKKDRVLEDRNLSLTSSRVGIFCVVFNSSVANQVKVSFHMFFRSFLKTQILRMKHFTRRRNWQSADYRGTHPCSKPTSKPPLQSFSDSGEIFYNAFVAICILRKLFVVIFTSRPT